ncbi:hypothetical protein [Paenibacillus sp. FSL H7-0357]|uniref:hypothetical protein n=1 Tax=unclassified Paenibacillus TaxID=185978 RepID=UPI003FA5F359
MFFLIYLEDGGQISDNQQKSIQRASETASHVLLLKNDGTIYVYTWGDNQEGQSGTQFCGCFRFNSNECHYTDRIHFQSTVLSFTEII